MLLVYVLWITWGLILLFCVFMLIRNFLVYRYRRHLLDRIHFLGKEDINSNRDWVWRFDVFMSVSYDAMLFRFWWPLKSFYPDKKFIER